MASPPSRGNGYTRRRGRGSWSNQGVGVRFRDFRQPHPPSGDEPALSDPLSTTSDLLPPPLDPLPSVALPRQLNKYEVAGRTAMMIAGKERDLIFQIHMKRLAKTSKWFETNRQPTSQPQTYPLPSNLSPDALAIYIGWLYNNRVELVDSVGSRHYETPDDVVHEENVIQRHEMQQHSLLSFAHRAVDCFVVGDFFQDQEFRNHLTLRLHSEFLHRPPPDPSFLQHMWTLLKDLPNGCKMIKLVTDYYALRCSVKEFNRAAEIMPKELLRMVATAAVKAVDRVNNLPEGETKLDLESLPYRHFKFHRYREGGQGSSPCEGRDEEPEEPSSTPLEEELDAGWREGAPSPSESQVREYYDRYGDDELQDARKSME